MTDENFQMSFSTAEVNSNNFNQNNDFMASDLNTNIDPNNLGSTTGVISFGANLSDLQIAAGVEELARSCQDTPLGQFFDGLANGLSGANTPGMEIIKTNVGKVADFYDVEPVKVFYEPGEPGVQWSGMTKLNYDNWIGGDPEVLSAYSQQYGTDFAENVIAHEFGHNMYSRLGGDESSRISNEAFADYAAGLYAGSRGLDPTGMLEFLAENPGDGKTYPEDRCGHYQEGYSDAQNYPWKDFQDIVDDPNFSLQEKMQEISALYA